MDRQSYRHLRTQSIRHMHQSMHNQSPITYHYHQSFQSLTKSNINISQHTHTHNHKCSNSNSKQNININSIKYSQLTKAIDKHNLHAVKQLQKCKNNIQLGINDQLITMYTDAVYQKYNIKKQVTNYMGNMGNMGNRDINIRQQINNNNKRLIVNSTIQHNKLIKLKLKNVIRNTKTNLSTPSLHLLGSPQNKYVPIKQISLININQSNNNTPIKPKILGIKKSGYSTTAGSNFSHGRSKTGVQMSAHDINSIQQIQKNDGSQTYRNVNSTSTKQLQRDVFISQFGQGWPQSEIQIQHKEQNTKSINNSLTEKNSNLKIKKIYNKQHHQQINQHYKTKVQENNDEKFTLVNQNKDTIKNCLCPICQEQVNVKQIFDHQESCKGLKQLYELSMDKLIQFVNWKINNHKGSILQLLKKNDVQTKNLGFSQLKSDNSKSYRKQTSQKKHSLSYQFNNYPYYGNISDQMKQTLSQCNQSMNKCFWFQIIKKNLLSKSEIIVEQQ